MKFIIGKRDVNQSTDNIFCISGTSIRQVTYNLKYEKSYTPPPLQPNYLPKELWDQIFDYMVLSYLQNFNYELLGNLFLISRSLLLRFYKIYILPDLNCNHSITIPERFKRIAGLLQTAELIYDELLGSNDEFQIDLFVKPLIFSTPMPWDIISATPFISTKTIVILDKNLTSIYNPSIYRIGNASAFIDGEIINSIIEPVYFRLPVLVLSLFTLDGFGPLMTFDMIKSSHCWKSLFKILKHGLGYSTGIYYSVKVTSLPDEFIFHDEIYIEP